ncbi:MAG: GntP family permease [Planctomycetota bacterium]|nr:MAG: GntP family permease [Planctomycetota bacterium]
MGIAGIFLSLGLLMILAYRGVNVIVLAPVLAMLAVACDGGSPLLANYTQVFMPAVGRFIANYLPLFMLGAIFGKLLEETGCTAAIARRMVDLLGAHRALLAIVLSSAILTYGGVSVFVVVFAVYPLAVALLRRADIPKRLLPGAIALGAATFTMTTLPGTLQVHNLIPMKFFGTTAFAAPLLGIIGSALMLGLGMAWLSFRARLAARASEGYGAASGEVPAAAERGALPPFAIAILPIVAVVALNFLFTEFVIRRWDTSYLAEPRFGATTVENLRGVWATILAMVSATALLAILRIRSLARLNDALSAGATSALLPILTTASEVGYGATIAGLSGFAAIKQEVLGIVPSNPLVSEAVCINLLAGITGSASGGLTIALETLGPTYLERGLASGISPDLLHRVAAMSSCGLDTLPHNGAVITLLLACGLTHRTSYLDIFAVSVVGPILATVLVVALGTFFPGLVLPG